MVDFILSFSTLAGLVLSMAITTAVGLAVYFASYRLMAKYKNDELTYPTRSLFRVVGMLVSLMLSLAFAEVVVELRAIENAIEREAVAISDIFYSLGRFDTDESRRMQSILLDYTQAVIDDDWPALANDRLGKKTGELRMQLEDGVLALEAAGKVQEMLWSNIQADVDAISDYRLIRLDNALAKPPIYIYAIFFGFLITMAYFGIFRPKTLLVVLVSLYTVFIGMVLYLILSFSDPFQGGIGVDSATFEHLVVDLRAKLK